MADGLLTLTVGAARRGEPAVAVPASMALAAGALAWYALNLRSAHGPAVLGWLAPPLALILAAASLRRVATAPIAPRVAAHLGGPGGPSGGGGLAREGPLSARDVPVAARRFWNQVAVVTGLCAVGVAI